jgi:hypothetical protein
VNNASILNENIRTRARQRIARPRLKTREGFRTHARERARTYTRVQREGRGGGEEQDV